MRKCVKYCHYKLTYSIVWVYLIKLYYDEIFNYTGPSFP